jgi:plasmid stabilization system protein ParE
LIVEFTPAAQNQVDLAAAWWRANRTYAPMLFSDELSEALALLAAEPLLAHVFAEVEGKVVRKVRLPRTRYALYFTIDGEIITVHALWHGSRGSGPPLL